MGELNMKNSYEMLFDDYVIELHKAVSFEEDRLDNIREKMLSEGKSQGEIDDFIIERFDSILLRSSHPLVQSY